MSYIFPHQPRPHNPEIPYPGEELPSLSRPIRETQHQHVSINSFQASPNVHPVRSTPPIQIPRQRSNSQSTPVDQFGRNSYGRSPSILSAARSPPTKSHHHNTCARHTASPVHFEPSSSYESPSQLKAHFRHLERPEKRHRHSSFSSSDDGQIDAYYRKTNSSRGSSDEDHHPRHSHHHNQQQPRKPTRHRQASVSDDMMRPGFSRHHSSSSYMEQQRRPGTPDSYSESRYQPAMSLPPQQPQQNFNYGPQQSHNYGPQQSHNYGPLPPQLHQSMAPTMMPGGDMGAMTVGGTPLPAHDYATFAAVSGNNVRALPFASPHYPAGPGGQVGYPNAMPLTSVIDMPPPAGHYGAPRHPSFAKPDYRRFCFSVGKADVPYSSLSVAPPPLGVGIPR